MGLSRGLIYCQNIQPSVVVYQNVLNSSINVLRKSRNPGEREISSRKKPVPSTKLPRSLKMLMRFDSCFLIGRNGFPTCEKVVSFPKRVFNRSILSVNLNMHEIKHVPCEQKTYPDQNSLEIDPCEQSLRIQRAFKISAQVSFHTFLRRCKA